MADSIPNPIHPRLSCRILAACDGAATLAETPCCLNLLLAGQRRRPGLQFNAGIALEVIEGG